MQAIEMLSEEHRLLTLVLTCLERLLHDTARTDELDGEAAARILLFLERFADGRHQDKEEEVLFPLLLRRAPGRVRRVVRALLAEHEKERQLFEALRGDLEGAAYGDPVSRDTFVVHAERYLSLQRRHAGWEDEHLLPLAESLLLESDEGDVLSGFARVEARHWAEDGFDAERSALELAERFALEFVGEPVTA